MPQGPIQRHLPHSQIAQLYFHYSAGEFPCFSEYDWRPEVSSLFQIGTTFFYWTSDIHQVQGHRCITREGFFEKASEGAGLRSKYIKSPDILRLIEPRRTMECIYYTKRNEYNVRFKVSLWTLENRGCKSCRIVKTITRCHACMYLFNDAGRCSVYVPSSDKMNSQQ